MKTNRLAVLAGSVALALTSLVGCSADSTPSNVANDQNLSNNALSQLQKGQPAHTYKYSQIRATLQAIEDAQANVTATTSFFFNQGVVDPISACPSIGFPLPSTTEITNPSQIDYNGGSGGGGNVVVEQADPTGVFSGASTGTYVLCVNPAGVQYIQYWEGFVQTVGSAATWDKATHTVVLSGAPTVTVAKKP